MNILLVTMYKMEYTEQEFFSGLYTVQASILENKTEYVGDFWFCKFVQEMQESFPDTSFTIQDTFLLDLFYHPPYKTSGNVEEITEIIIDHYCLPKNKYYTIIKLIFEKYGKNPDNN